MLQVKKENSKESEDFRKATSTPITHESSRSKIISLN